VGGIFVFLGVEADYSSILAQVDFSFGPMSNSTFNVTREAAFVVDAPTMSPTYTIAPSMIPTLSSMPTNVLQNVTLLINFDTFSSVSLSWRIIRSDGKVVKEIKAGTYGPFDGDIITEEMVLELDGIYVFTIRDDTGDGICCNAGDGYAAIYFGTNSSANEVLLYDRGDFQYERSQLFTVSRKATFVATQSPSSTPTSSNAPSASLAPTSTTVDVIVEIQFDL
jgi:hypothetical protein